MRLVDHDQIVGDAHARYRALDFNRHGTLKQVRAMGRCREILGRRERLFVSEPLAQRDFFDERQNGQSPAARLIVVEGKGKVSSLDIDIHLQPQHDLPHVVVTGRDVRRFSRRLDRREQQSHHDPDDRKDDQNLQQSHSALRPSDRDGGVANRPDGAIGCHTASRSTHLSPETLPPSE